MKFTNPYGPNTTVLLPGSCNAKCDFCFWDRKSAKIKPPEDYLDKVFSILNNLPSQCRTLSISGGEPTLSPWLPKFLARLSVWRRSHHLDRVVLTTHGGNLLSTIGSVASVVDHINISRHAITDEDNWTIFKTDKIPDSRTLSLLISRVHDLGTCDVTLNCVVPPDVTSKFCKDYIKFAKDVGADAVSFRKVASDVTPTKAERKFAEKYGVGSETKCPVCRGMEQTVKGFPVRWKGSVEEPSLETKGIYEVVIHPDGLAYSDWGRTTLIPALNKQAPPKRKTVSVRASGCQGRSSGRGGCGGGGGGCGGGSGSSGCGSSGMGGC
jgi:MoaA/NifB/PqqE/SkfB family radical SAM enzyme